MFRFDSYALATAMEIQFPIGDTYQFDLAFFRDEEPRQSSGYDGEPFRTVTVSTGGVIMSFCGRSLFFSHARDDNYGDTIRLGIIG